MVENGRPSEIASKFRQFQEQEFNNRLRRLLELDRIRGVIVDPSAIHFPPSDSVEAFVKEAADAYVHDMYRSCIFACATAVNHIFLSTLIKLGNFRLEEARKLDEDFAGTIIEKMKEIPRYMQIAQRAEWLNRTRKKVAAHPHYVKGRTGTTKLEHDFETALMARSAQSLLDLLEPNEREQIEKSEITMNGKSLTYEESLTKLDWIRTETVWYMLQAHLIPMLAFKAYKILYETMREFETYATTVYHTRAPYEAHR